MGLSTWQLLQTAQRFQQRNAYQKSRKTALLNMDAKMLQNAFDARKLLNQLDAKERVQKRLQRLQSQSGNIENAAQKSTAIATGNDAVERSFLKRIIGKDDLLPVYYLEKGLQAARSVGKVIIKNSFNQVLGFSTGFMISPRIFMTNHHVLPGRRDALYSQVEMNHQLDGNGNLLPSVLFSFQEEDFFYTSQELDVTLIAIKGNTEQNGTGWNRLIEEEGKVLIGEYMNIIQHPDGRPKEFSFRGNRLLDVLPQFLHYQTDTEPGSSGAPVYNDQWELVALHHSGVPQRDENGNIVTRDGALWLPSMGESRIHWIANEGIRASTIAKFIKSLKLAAGERKLRNEIFEKTPENSTSPLSHPTGQHTIEITANLTDLKNTDGVLLLQIPLQINLGVINSEQQQDPANAGINTIAIDNSDPTIQARYNGQLKAALKELEAARSRPYYDKAEDDKSKKLYYKGIEKSEKDGQQFYKQLSNLLTQTHTNQLTYQPSKYVYTWVDWQPNKKLRSIYSWKEYEPAQLIQHDLEAEMRLEGFTENLLQKESLSQQQQQQKIALFEASLPYNCEHVVPQSWFGKEEPMRGDLHHLFTCEWGCNSFRNKIPYFDFSDFEEVVRHECGKREENKFEPGNGKGEVARATLYFLLRYPSLINANANEYTPDRIKMLLSWHQTFKVTPHEKHRNAAIFAMQGNRNPLIDYPQWAKKIDFVKGLGKRK